MANRAYAKLSPKGITKDGQAWLTTALDPFHDDISVRPVGLPDKNYNPSIVKVYNKQVTIRKPEGVADGELWNCHIFTSPVMNTSPFRKSEMYGNGRVTTVTADGTIYIGTVTAVTYKEDESWFLPNSNDAFTEDTESLSISVDEESNSSINNTLSRLVGGGFEVSNDTAELYKQGHVTCYSTCNPPTNDIIPGWTLNGTDTTKTPYTHFRRQPDSIQQARSIQNSTSWRAVDGCYVPFRINLDNNEYHIRSHTPLVFSGSRNFNAPGNEQILISAVDPSSFDANQFPQLDTPILAAGLHNSGAIFTGLSSQTTLTLSVRFIEEVAPIDNSDLLAYGSQLNLYDPIALESYQRLMQVIPVAVTFDENNTAEFWSKVLSAAGKVLPIVGSAVGMPTIGAALGTVADAGSERLKEKAAKQKAEIKQLTSKVKDLKTATTKMKKVSAPQAKKK